MVGVARYRCSHCGNKTRFDVYERLERRRFAHYDLAGSAKIEDEETLSEKVLRVVCRWCDADDGIEELQPAARRRTTS